MQLLKSLAPRIADGQWTVGDTKVFFKDIAFHELMEVRGVVVVVVPSVGGRPLLISCVLAMAQIRKVASVRYAIKIQALWRMYVDKKVYRRQQWAATKFQGAC